MPSLIPLPPPPCAMPVGLTPLPPMVVPVCMLNGQMPTKTGLTPILKQHGYSCCVVVALICAIPWPRSAVALNVGLIPSMQPTTVVEISGVGDMGWLLIASLLATAVILGWSWIFSPAHPKSQVDISITSWVWAVSILLSNSVIVTLLPLILSFSFHMPILFPLFLFYHHLHILLYDTIDWQAQRPYVEGHSQASPVFNSDRLCYQALGLIFCTNTRLLHLKPLMTNPLSLWIL